MKDIDDTKAPLMEHLVELRRRLLWCLAALALAFFTCLYFAREIFSVLVQPLLAAGQGRLIYTDIFEAFFVEVKVALFAALMITFPVLASVFQRGGYPSSLSSMSSTGKRPPRILSAAGT